MKTSYPQRHVVRYLQWCLLAVTLGGVSATADNITWVGTDFPPMEMSQREYAHEGYIDALYKYVQESVAAPEAENYHAG